MGDTWPCVTHAGARYTIGREPCYARGMSGDHNGHGLQGSGKPCEVCRVDVRVVWYRGTSICAACLGNRGILPTNAAREFGMVHARQHRLGAAMSKQALADRDRSVRLTAEIATRKAVASSHTRLKQIDSVRLMKRQGATSG